MRNNKCKIVALGRSMTQPDIISDVQSIYEISTFFDKSYDFLISEYMSDVGKCPEESKREMFSK